IFKNKNEWIILYANFKLPKANLKEAEEKIERFHIARHSYQEFVYPTLGSIFSTRKDIYLSMLLEISKMSFWKGWDLKLIFRKPISKRMIKYSQFKEYNELKMKTGYFSNTKQPISKKTINTLINTGAA